MLFTPQPKARSDRKAGTLYAVDGDAGWVYYGQYAADGTMGFFRFRSAQLAPADEVLRQPLMSRIFLMPGATGRGLRDGRLHKMGRYPVHAALRERALAAVWPVGSIMLTVMRGGDTLYEARMDDPRIQDLEIAAAWDSVHLPDRLVADFGAERPAFPVGGLIWRVRKEREEEARLHRDLPGHELPDGWIWLQEN